MCFEKKIVIYEFNLAFFLGNPFLGKKLLKYNLKLIPSPKRNTEYNTKSTFN